MRSPHAHGLALSLALGSLTGGARAQSVRALEALCPCPRAHVPATHATPATTDTPSGYGRSVPSFIASGLLLGLGVGAWLVREDTASAFNRSCWLIGDDGVSSQRCGSLYNEVVGTHIAAITLWSASAGLLTLGTVFTVLDRRTTAHSAASWWVTPGPVPLGAGVGGRF